MSSFSHFPFMTRQPWPFLFFLPALFLALTFWGWTRDDLIEDNVAEIWIPTKGGFAKDRDYAAEYDRETLDSTSFLAMALSRDGGNLFTSTRLEEIRARMERTEQMTVAHKGITYTWDDICFSNRLDVGTSYEWPCIRLSPMDLFQEARWFMDETDRLTWYHEFVRAKIVRPRIPRFGVMTSDNCAPMCGDVVQSRTNATYAKEQDFPEGYAEPLSLFSDIGNLELSHPCRICFDQGVDVWIGGLHATITRLFDVIHQEISRALSSGQVPTPQVQLLQTLFVQVSNILGEKLDRLAVQDFVTYNVTRGLYAQLGVPGYLRGYQEYVSLAGPACVNLTKMGAPLTCPPAAVSPLQAQAALLAHADNTFSSITTSGSPFPFWDEGDGSGNLFAGTSPVSGSGLDLSGTSFSSMAYFDVANYGKPEWNPVYGKDGILDIFSPEFIALVERDPVYTWFLAGETPMTSHCGNGNLPGTPAIPPFVPENIIPGHPTEKWCTKFNPQQDTTLSRQDFARMFYDLLIDSPGFLGITQGTSDPYTWTTGQGCGYDLGGHRDPYADTTDILRKASRELYYIDEGAAIGALDRNLLMGDTTPAIGEFDSQENPLEHVGVIQTIYPALIPEDILKRVRNCNRPGGPVSNITLEDAKDILKEFKNVFEDTWAMGWDDDTQGQVQFVGYFDETGVLGTAGRVLRDITLDNGTLLAVSILIIVVFSVLFLANFGNMVQSRIMITLMGVGLVLLAFFAALGLGVLLGIKIFITTAWTLPFVIIGLGVDNVYIVLLALKQGGNAYSKESFLHAMKDVIVPITMASTVTASMFAIMNISDIPAVFRTAQTGLITVVFLYLIIVFCFPAYCFLDLQRQAAGRYDVLFCKKKEESESDGGAEAENPWASCMYDKLYKPLVLGQGFVRILTHILLWSGAAALFAVGIYGCTQREVGLGLEDFFPTDHQGHLWATVRTEELASWSLGMAWGAIDYKSPSVQMRMIQMFEDVIATPHVAEQDTKQLWIADFAIWSSRLCEANALRSDPEILECGYDQEYIDPVTSNSAFCTATWTENALGLRLKTFEDPKSSQCEPLERGICRPTSQMHPADLGALGINPSDPGEKALAKEWCPVLDGWSDGQWQFCLQRWRNITDGGKGRLVLKDERGTPTQECPSGDFYEDERIEWPIPISTGPSMFGFGLNSHEDTTDLIEETRAVCDDADDLHCFMTGIPFDYWSQYIGIFNVLLEISGSAVAVGFGVSFLFLFAKLATEANHGMTQVAFGSFVGAFLITIVTILSLVAVAGISILSGVSLTGFSNMAFVLSVGFAVEYSVHIVARWLRADGSLKTAQERVEYTMSFLVLPTFMSFVSSTIGVSALAFTDFKFNEVFFFRPLIVVMFITYFYGCWWLPALLTLISSDKLNFGEEREVPAPVKELETEEHLSTLMLNETGPDSSGAVKVDCTTHTTDDPTDSQVVEVAMVSSDSPSA